MENIRENEDWSTWTIADAREAGCAVALFEPKELNGADPRIIEDVMIECAWDAIESSQD